MTSPARRTALCCRQKPWKLERNRGEISKRVEQETSDIIDPGQRTDEDCARCSRGWWLSDSGSAPADKLSRNNGHTPPKEEGGHRIHTKKRRERESKRVATTVAMPGFNTNNARCKSGVSRAGHGLWSQDVPWCGGGIDFTPSNTRVAWNLFVVR